MVICYFTTDVKLKYYFAGIKSFIKGGERVDFYVFLKVSFSYANEGVTVSKSKKQISG